MAEPNLMSLNERLGTGHANKTSVTEVHYIELPITIRLVRCTHTGDVIAVSVPIAQITCWQRLVEAVFFERFRRLVVATRRKAYGLRGRLHHGLRLKIAWNTHKNQRLQNIYTMWFVDMSRLSHRSRKFITLRIAEKIQKQAKIQTKFTLVKRFCSKISFLIRSV